MTAAELFSAWEQARAFFTEEVAGLTADGEDGSLGGRWQSIHTEMHREMKLLATEISFYQIARSPAMQQQRKGQIGDRAQRLIGYCHAMLEIE